MPNLNFIDHPLTDTPFGAALDLCLVLTGETIADEQMWAFRSG